MKIYIVKTFILTFLSLNASAQSGSMVSDLRVAKDIAECSIAINILGYAGHASKKEVLQDLNLTENDRLIIDKNKKIYWKYLSDFALQRTKFVKAYASLHEYYKTTDSSDSMADDGIIFEQTARKDHARGIIGEDFIKTTVKCLYIMEEFRSIDFDKQKTIHAYNAGEAKYTIEMKDVNFKNSFNAAITEMSKYSFLAWRNYAAYQSNIESHILTKRLVKRFIDSQQK